MKSTHMLATLMTVAAAFGASQGSFAASGDDCPQDTIAAPSVDFIDYWYGATLGPDWTGFPTVLATDYNSTRPLEHLDITLPIYLEYETVVRYGSCGTCPGQPQITKLSPPRPLSSAPWFIGHSDEFYSYFEVPDDYASDTEYNSCPAGRGNEIPLIDPNSPAALTPDGRLRIKDTHGGIGTSSLIMLFRLDAAGSLPQRYRIVLRWNKVQSYTDLETNMRVDALPGTPVVRDFQWWGSRIDCAGGQYCGPYTIRYRMMNVEWVSTDIAGVTPRTVDEYDLTELVSHLGEPVAWGFDPPVGGGPQSRTYHVNVAPFGDSASFIDASDLSAMCTDLLETCDLANAATADAAAILRWFGIAPTGGTIAVSPNGETIPEYQVIDWEQARRARANPAAFRGPPAAATNMPWSSIKSFYR